VANLGVGGLREVLVPLADGIEIDGRVQADNLVSFTGNLLTHRRRSHGNCNDDSGLPEKAEGSDGGAHGGAGGEAVIHQDYSFAVDTDWRARAAISTFPAVEFEALAGRDGLNLLGLDPHAAGKVRGDDFDSAWADSAEGK